MSFTQYILLLIIIVFFKFDSIATSYYVDDGSNAGDTWTGTAVGNDANDGLSTTTPKATIASVLSTYALVGGDVIYVDVGSYTETAINIGTADDGAGGSYVTIQGAGTSSTIFTTAATAHTFSFSTANVQYIKIMDLKVTKSSISYNAVNFSASGVNNIWFENCLLTQASNNEVVYGSNSSVTACSDIKYNNCVLTNTSTSSDADGIEFNENFDNVTISNNTFNIDGTGTGILSSVTNSSYAITGTSINTNTINMNHTTAAVEGILMNGLVTADFYSNTITIPSTSNSSSGIALKAGSSSALIPTTCNIYSNTITAYGTGIYILGYDSGNPAKTINIYSNTVTMSSSSAGHVGMELQYAGSSGNPITIYKNRMISGYYGIDLYDYVTYCQVYNNYVSNNAYCLYSQASTNNNTDIYFNSFYGTTNGAYFAELSATHNLKNNIFYSTSASATDYAIEIIVGTLCASMNYNEYYVPNGARVGYFAGSYTTFANWQAVDKVSGGTLGEENGQSGNPIYDNAAGNDLDIHSTSSKAYLLGTPIGGITTDIYGTTRNVTTPWIGAFETTVGLPIELIYFNVYQKNNEIVIDWKTETERDNDFFTIEKSLDGKSFKVLTYEKGAGTTTEEQFYTYSDFEPFKGISYYRLSQTDFDGTNVEFDIKSIQFKAELGVYPNPSHYQYFIYGIPKNTNAKIRVYDLNNKEVSAIEYKDNGIVIVELVDIPEGIYILKIVDDYNEWVEKLIKIN